MTEKLLQYIWQFQYFNRADLRTAAGEALEVIHPGTLNHDQGPDFQNAQVRVGGTLLAGSVELHLSSGLWQVHGHDRDANYRNVVLHVVYIREGAEPPGVPVLELQPRVSRLLLERYTSLMAAPSFIPCGAAPATVRPLVWESWKERLLAERLSRKAERLFHYQADNRGHWEESFWWLLARNFGVRVNADAFEAVARSLSLSLLSRHRDRIQLLEALLLGQARLLQHDFSDEYPRMLKREYAFLQKKYKLRPVELPVHFLRMRPGNFPTIRLAQLAALVQGAGSVFPILLDTEDLGPLRKRLTVTANDYWHYHYRPDELSPFREKTLGKEMIDSLVVNTLAPALFAYGMHQKEEKYRERALSWLQQTAAESNAVTRGFSLLALQSRTAFDSQALLELKTRYCDEKRCLSCAVGNALLRSEVGG